MRSIVKKKYYKKKSLKSNKNFKKKFKRFKKFKIYWDIKYVNNRFFKFKKLKFFKKRVQVFKKYYIKYTNLNKKYYRKIILFNSLKNQNNKFLLENRLDIFLARLLFWDIEKVRNFIRTFNVSINGTLKSCNYILKNGDILKFHLRVIKDKKVLKNKLKRVVKSCLIFKRDLVCFILLKNSSKVFIRQKKNSIWQKGVTSKHMWQFRINFFLKRKIWAKKNMELFLCTKIV